MTFHEHDRGDDHGGEYELTAADEALIRWAAARPDGLEQAERIAGEWLALRRLVLAEGEIDGGDLDGVQELFTEAGAALLTDGGRVWALAPDGRLLRADRDGSRVVKLHGGQAVETWTAHPLPPSHQAESN